MQIILLERIGRFGNLGDVVDVKSGYARNFLIPKGKALRASKENIAKFEERRAELEKENQTKRDEATKTAEAINDSAHIVIRAASDSGALFGSVTPRDIGDAMLEAGHDIPRQMIVLDRPIKELGIHNVRVILHPEVEAGIRVNVARSEEEARLQEEGKTVRSLAMDAEAEAEADLAAMLDEVGAASDDMNEGLRDDTPQDDTPQHDTPEEAASQADKAASGEEDRA